MPSEIIIIIKELMFLGVNKFLAFLRAHFSLSRAKNIHVFKPTKINSFVIGFKKTANKIEPLHRCALNLDMPKAI